MNKIIIKTLLIIIIIVTQFSFCFSINTEYLKPDSYEHLKKMFGQYLDNKILKDKIFQNFIFISSCSFLPKKKLKIITNKYFNLSNNKNSDFLINVLNNPPLRRCHPNRISGKSVLETFWLLYPQKTKEWINSNMENFNEYGISEIMIASRYMSNKYAINFAYNYLNNKIEVTNKFNRRFGRNRYRIKGSNYILKYNDYRLCDYAYNLIIYMLSNKKIKIKNIDNTVTIYEYLPIEIRDKKIEIFLKKKDNIITMLNDKTLISPRRF